MNTMVLTKTKFYTDNNIDKEIKYTLLTHNTPIGLVYDISCSRISPDGIKTEICNGITQNKNTAVKIFNIIADNIVAPEHLACIIDDLYSEI